MSLCPSCGQSSQLYFESKDYNRCISGEKFNYFRCPSCELIFISPIPSNLSDYYTDTYYFVPDNAQYLVEGASHERYKIDIVQRFANGGRLLEIGPSYGCFTYLAKNAGFDVHAIEMDKHCCDFLAEVIGVKTINSDDPVAALQMFGNYDVIVLWHVIEHLPEPWQLLDVINSKLNPGGILLVAAPNPQSLQFFIMGRYWPHVDAPRHLTLIPIKLLIGSLIKKGMRLELVTTKDEGSIGWNQFGWMFFFSNLSSNSFIKRLLRYIGKLVCLVLHPLESIEGRGSAYTLVVRKEN